MCRLKNTLIWVYKMMFNENKLIDSKNKTEHIVLRVNILIWLNSQISGLKPIPRCETDMQECPIWCILKVSKFGLTAHSSKQVHHFMHFPICNATRFSWFILSTLLCHIDLNYYCVGSDELCFIKWEDITLPSFCVLLMSSITHFCFYKCYILKMCEYTGHQELESVTLLKRNPDVAISWLACLAPISSSFYRVLLSSRNIICPSLLDP